MYSPEQASTKASVVAETAEIETPIQQETIECNFAEYRDPMDIDEHGRQGEKPKPSILVLPNEILLSIGVCLDEVSLAAMVQTSRFMKNLLTKQLYIKAVDFMHHGYDTVVEWAAAQGQLSTIQKVFEQTPADADWGRIVSDGIIAAVGGNKVDTLEFLCRHRASLIYPLNPQLTAVPTNKRGIVIPNSPVNIAAHCGSYEALEFLLESGVPFNMPPLRKAALMLEGTGGTTGNTRVAKLLIRHGFDVHLRGVSNHTLLHDLAARGSIAHVDLLAATVPEYLNHQDLHGRTPLMHAITAGQFHCARHMVTSLGADVAVSSATGTTALHTSVKSNAIDLVETLVSHGANLNAEDTGKMTALHVATDTCFGPIKEPRMVAVLLDAGAFCSPVDAEGNTPLSNALLARNREIADRLMLAGAVHHAYEFERLEVMMNACRVGCMDIIQMYTNRKRFNIEDHEDRWMRTALHLAATDGHFEVLVFLLRKWRDVDRRDAIGRTALWYAARTSKPECVNVLIEAGASVDMGDDQGWTPLMNLTRNTDNRDAMTRFLQLSKDVEWRDDKGRTVLHHAARRGNIPAMHAIIDFRDSLVSQVDNRQHSALMVAIIHGRADVALFLKEFISLSRADFKDLVRNGCLHAVSWIQTGPEWESTRQDWRAVMGDDDSDDVDSEVEPAARQAETE
ncbi:ankyrin [Aspergillus steynii IBT 23096]|uniref:Ankyrin n=1 Tax=Aspergillus steynii IBT 23096 TaxID=1392250 RepID=A0A2I2FS16_9EURO|nr:ankyrin [Aspergillus steynii IBT 23096]PLB43428.1 ankyrin [Aspergillus steynii IBT 23096]